MESKKTKKKRSLSMDEEDLDYHEEEIDTNNCIQSKLNNQIIYTSDNIQLKKDINNNSVIKYIRTTPGRILLNEVFHLNNQ